MTPTLHRILSATIVLAGWQVPPGLAGGFFTFGAGDHDVGGGAADVTTAPRTATPAATPGTAAPAVITPPRAAPAAAVRSAAGYETPARTDRASGTGANAPRYAAPPDCVRAGTAADGGSRCLALGAGEHDL